MDATCTTAMVADAFSGPSPLLTCCRQKALLKRDQLINWKKNLLQLEIQKAFGFLMTREHSSRGFQRFQAR